MCIYSMYVPCQNNIKGTRACVDWCFTMGLEGRGGGKVEVWQGEPGHLLAFVDLVLRISSTAYLKGGSLV